MGNGWTYRYDADKIRGFKQTHQPSPWMNDYGQFSIMPTLSLIHIACDWTSSSPVASLRRATGWPFEVVVVMDRDAWNGEVGELLQEQLREMCIRDSIYGFNTRYHLYTKMANYLFNNL